MEQQQTLERPANKEYRTSQGRRLQLLFGALKACSISKDLKQGKIIHEALARSGELEDVRVSSTLVDMYAKCGSLVDAREVFDKMQNRDVIAWNALIFGYADNGEGELALQLFSFMEEEPNALTFVAALKACSSMAVKEVASKQTDGKLVKVESRARGKAIHIQVSSHRCFSDIRVLNTLVAMYAKCGCMKEARDIFDSMKQPDVVSWTALILGYAENGEGRDALELFFRMGNAANSVTFVAALKACASLAAEEIGVELEGRAVKVGSRDQGRAIHSWAVTCKCSADKRVANTLIDMYAKCGSMEDARRAFDAIKRPDVVSWNALLFGYADNGDHETVLQLFSSVRPDTMDALTFVAALKACTSLAACENGEKVDGKPVKVVARGKGVAIYQQALRRNCGSDIRVLNTLVDLFGKCGSMADARKIFDGMQQRDVVSWNVLILGYAETGEKEKALELFSVMNCEPNALSYIAALKASDSLENGMALHSQTVNSGYDLDGRVANTLVDMYAKCGGLVDARRVFTEIRIPRVVSWTTMIFGYVEQNEGGTALELFWRMEHEGCSPDSLTFVAALKACTSLAMQEEKQLDGKPLKVASQEICMEIHYRAWKNNCDSDIRFASTLVDTYANCGSLVDAQSVFDGIRKPDVVCWTALILGYADNGEGQTALRLFTRMRSEGSCVPDVLTFSAALKACGIVGALDAGKSLHEDICKLGYDNDACLMTSLVDFYGKCGNMVYAEQVFGSISAKNSVSWTALISGYSLQGNTERVFELYEKMQTQAHLPANEVTLLCVLSACSHAGLVEKGQGYFYGMSSLHGICPSLEHYTCMVDIYGRANKIDDAFALVSAMPFSPDVVTWTTLLSACRKWKNVELGRLAFETMVTFDEKDSGAYALMANIYDSPR